MVTVGPRRSLPLASSVAMQVQAIESPWPVTSYCSGLKRPQPLIRPMMNWLLHDGRPWMMCRFCITWKGDIRIRFAISSATKQLAKPCCP